MDARPDSSAAVLPRAAVLSCLAYLACLILSVGMFFREQLTSGFTRLFGDRTDAVIEIAILEHWRNVLRGFSRWSTAFFYYPDKGNLGYNDAYFLYGLAYSLFRQLGFDPYLSSELVNVTLRVIAFVAFHLFLRRCLLLSPGWSLLGAVLFTLSCTMAMRANHAQLLSVDFVPLFALLVWNAATALAADAPRHLLQWGASAALLMAAWLLTTYYMAWFTLFFVLCMVAVSVLTRPRSALAHLRAVSPRGWVALAVIAGVFAVGILPFLSLYLPKAAATGMHPAEEVIARTIEPLDLVNLGTGNLLFSRLDVLLNQYFRPEMPLYSERTTGLTPFVLLVFGLACASLWTRRWTPTREGWRIWLLATTAVVTWFLALRVGGWSLWTVVYDITPGAKGLRVVTRYQLFLAAPVIAVAVAYLAALGARAPRPLAAIVAIMLVAEQITVEQPIELDRPAELAQLHSTPAPPAACRSFFVSRARAGTHMNVEINDIYSHNVDAMLLAELFRLPTINGFGTFTPADWDFVGPEQPDYLQRVRTYVQAHHLVDVCAVDLPAGRWDVHPLD